VAGARAGSGPAGPLFDPLFDPERIGPVLALILFLIILWMALAVLGAVVHGLFWLLVIASLFFLATLVFGRGRLNRGRGPR
jgi:hypothetical protein